MTTPHMPVMLDEIVEALTPQAGETYVDATFGFGGYSEAILEAGDCHLIALDRDPNVRARAEQLEGQYGPRFRFIQTAFSKMADLNLPPLDGIVLDIGVSSMQIDRSERGFSFMRNGPLDMRMSAEGVTAAQAVAELSRESLIAIFRAYGEERRAARIADFIVRAREEVSLDTTGQLAELVEQAIGRSGKTHPATRVFQALRIFINDELGELYRALCAAENLLKPQGRLVVVTFHSLEDRVVKKFLRRRADKARAGSRYLPPETAQAGQASSREPSFSQYKRSVIKPSQAEINVNSRSRSAKLRVGIRTLAPAFASDDELLPGIISVREMEANP